MKKLFLMLVLAGVSLFAQTPCIEDAKAGKVGQCFDVSVPVTGNDARYVPVQVISGYTVSPAISRSLAFEFSSQEQAVALSALITKLFPGSKLTVSDYGNQFYFSPFRKLQYFNDGGLFAPRLYQISGTVMLDGTATPIAFSVGWSINVVRLLYGGSFETQELGYPYGNYFLTVVVSSGLAQPVWVGGPKQ